jgi:hypothetical protein
VGLPFLESVGSRWLEHCSSYRNVVPRRDAPSAKWQMITALTLLFSKGFDSVQSTKVRLR